MLTNKQKAGGRKQIAIPACLDDSAPQKVCMDSTGEIQLGNTLNSFISVHAFDNKNNLIDPEDIDQTFKQKLLAGDVMSLPLIPRWHYEIISYEGLRYPSASGTRVDARTDGYFISGWASDDYGSDVKAKLCLTGYEGDSESERCSEMEPITLTYGAMRRFSSSLPLDHVFTGQEHMVISNSSGDVKVALESVDVTQVGFQQSGITQELDRYYQNILNKIKAYEDNISPEILNRLNNDKRVSNVDEVKAEIAQKKAEVQALVSYCSKQQRKEIDQFDQLNEYSSKCQSDIAVTALNDLKAEIDARLVLPDWSELIDKKTVGVYGGMRDGFSFWRARRDMETDSEEPSDWEYFDVGVECVIPEDRVITFVRVSAGLKGNTKGSSKIRRFSSHFRQIFFDSYKINPQTGNFENKKTHNCETRDDDAFWRTEKNRGNYSTAAQGVDPNKKEYVTDVRLSLDRSRVKLCIKYAQLDNKNSQLNHKGQKGERCNDGEKHTWRWIKDNGKSTSPLRGIKVGNGHGTKNNAKIHRDAVLNLASWYNRIHFGRGNIYNNPVDPKLSGNE